MKKETRYLVHAALIAALYVVLTYIANLFGLANYAIQIRFSEALTILPFFTPAAIPGLFVGCILANTLTGCMLWDILLGSLATLLGAVGSFFLSQKIRGRNEKAAALLTPLPPILANVCIVPMVLAYVYCFEGSLLYFAITVGIGEIISCGILGLLLLGVLKKYQKFIFM